MLLAGKLRDADILERIRLSGLLRILLLVAMSAWSTGRTQTPLTKTLLPASPSSVTNVHGSILEAGKSGETIREKLAKVRLERSELPKDPFSGNVRTDLLVRLEQLYEQQLSYIQELETLKARTSAITLEAKSWTSFSEPQPYSIFLTDEIHESIRVERDETTRGESSLVILGRLTEEHRKLLERSEERVRQLNESLEDGADAQNQSRERDLERLRSQVSAATIGVLDLERQIQNERLSASRVRLDLLKKQFVIASAGTVFTQGDLEKVRAILEGERQQVENELGEMEKRWKAASEALEAASSSLRQTRAAAATNTALIERAQEVVELRRTQLETIETALNVFRFSLQAGAVARRMWEARFDSYRTSSAATVRGAERQLAEFRSRVELWRSYYASQLETASRRVARQQERLAALEPGSELASLVRERLDSLRERDQVLMRVIRQIERGDRSVQRLTESLREASATLPFWARVRNAFSDTQSMLSRIWNLELFVAQDTIEVEGQQITGKRSVTLGKIVSALLILIIGYWLTDLLARFSQPLIVSRFKIDRDQANLIRRWVRVFLVLALALFSLVFVKIPLTVFAFAGGALMIALGFGMQTLLKNFVSGIIILFERPFRVGDILDVGGQRGKIVGVGIRSSVLQLWDGKETLIPNSALLENSVTNWTYSNRNVRFNVTVGVAYGSDTRRVVQLLTEIVGRHGLIEKEPAPQILLVNFGDSALTFDIRFWVDVIKANAAQVESDLRQMIAVAFAEQGIVIAFPQQELHLDLIKPLQIQVLAPTETKPQDGKLAESESDRKELAANLGRKTETREASALLTSNSLS